MVNGSVKLLVGANGLGDIKIASSYDVAIRGIEVEGTRYVVKIR